MPPTKREILRRLRQSELPVLPGAPEPVVELPTAQAALHNKPAKIAGARGRRARGAMARLSREFEERASVEPRVETLDLSTAGTLQERNGRFNRFVLLNITAGATLNVRFHREDADAIPLTYAIEWAQCFERVYLSWDATAGATAVIVRTWAFDDSGAPESPDEEGD